jgi:hypothetical protein
VIENMPLPAAERDRDGVAERGADCRIHVAVVVEVAGLVGARLDADRLGREEWTVEAAAVARLRKTRMSALTSFTVMRSVQPSLSRSDAMAP